MAAALRHSRTATMGLVCCLLLAGCKPPQESGQTERQQVFPDPAAVTPAVPVDVPGALALRDGAVGLVEADALGAVPAAGRCALDSVNGQESDGIELSRTVSAHFSGWIASAAPRPAFALMLEGETIFAISAAAMADRPDVAEAIGLREGHVSDYEAVADLRGLPTGTYAVHLLLDDGGTLAKCALNRKVTLR